MSVAEPAPTGLDHGPAARSARRPRRWPRRMALLAGLSMALVLAPSVWTHVAARGRVHEAEVAPSAPVTLVLGAGVWNGRPSPFLAARLDVAIELYASGRTEVILVSGDNRVAEYDEPTAMRRYLIEHGIPERRVVADFAGRDTYDSCARAKRIFGVDRLLVVSQGYHLPRAVATCRALGLDAAGVGDWTVRRYAETWSQGQLREVPAAGKAVVDLASRRDPVLGEPEDSVSQALLTQR